MAQVLFLVAALFVATAVYFVYKISLNNTKQLKRLLRRKDAQITELQGQLRQEKQKSNQLQQQIDNMLKTGYAEHGYSGH